MNTCEARAAIVMDLLSFPATLHCNLFIQQFITHTSFIHSCTLSIHHIFYHHTMNRPKSSIPPSFAPITNSTSTPSLAAIYNNNNVKRAAPQTPSATAGTPTNKDKININNATSSSTSSSLALSSSSSSSSSDALSYTLRLVYHQKSFSSEDIVINPAKCPG